MARDMQFNLTPVPRFLQRLGDINVEQFRCIAELVDNSVDAFLDALRQGHQLERCEILVTLPTADHPEACITIADNGLGMSAEQLERAVRAGWSSTDSNDHLGLFGMGFNLATARLGLLTEVFTTRTGDPQWIGVRIDFKSLERQNTFLAPGLTMAKNDRSVHGTTIRIRRLRMPQRIFFSKSQNIQSIRNELARIYAPLLRSTEHNFYLEINRSPILPRHPCHWDERRFVTIDKLGPVHAVERFDFPLPSCNYCSSCLMTFSGDAVCPQCGEAEHVRPVQRRIHGWVGLQRFIHTEKYGVDLVRNGRVIESLNKDLFIWQGDDRSEREYPVDDQRHRGRIIGEIHIDHGAVSFTKDSFERDDPAWQEMVSLVRGDGPLHPNKARKIGFTPSTAPLYRLFQAFRRNEPKPPTPWSQVLAVKDYKLAETMAERFYQGDPEYQTDAKWYELVERQDREIAALTAPGAIAAARPADFPADFMAKSSNGDNDDTKPSPPGSARLQAVTSSRTIHPVTRRRALPHLIGTYRHRFVSLDFRVAAFAVDPQDPDLPTNSPWTLMASTTTTGGHLFLVNENHPIFQSLTMTPRDALLTEMAVRTYEFVMDEQRHQTNFSEIFADFRQAYGIENALDHAQLVSAANETLRNIATSIAAHQSPKALAELFNELDDWERETISRRAAQMGATRTKDFVDTGEFLAYADHDTVRFFVGRYPELFFDGKYWDRRYTDIAMGKKTVNDTIRQTLSEQFDGYLADAIWLASKAPKDLERQERNSVMRAALSLRLLTPSKA